MLKLVLPAVDDECPEALINLEHSLLSLSKWESIHKKVFFGVHEEKTHEESISYIECMLLDDPPKNFLERLNSEHVLQVHEYLNTSHTATTFREENSNPSRQVITSELIYSWMIQFQIPFECESWNFSRLMTLIKICGINQTKPKKISRAEAAARQRKLNEERRAQMGTRG